MPVFRQGDTPPGWCELRDFAVIDLARGESVAGERRAAKERLLVTLGAAQLSFAGGSQVLREGQFLDLPPEASTWTALAPRDAQIVRISGHWGTELGGCGVVNPRVLTACGVDPERYTGFAFGFGIDRTLMFRHGVEDLRSFFEGDVRFARAFGTEI